jgi:hypothetical protein
MTDVAPTHALTVVLDGVPADLAPQIRMTPRELDGLDPALLRWARTPVDGARGALAGFTPAGRRLERAAQAGVWWITAALLYDASGKLPGQALPDSWFAVAAHSHDGAALTAHRDGFLLPVTGPVTVTLRLEPRPTSMLD